jgi:hypothetical protein
MAARYIGGNAGRIAVAVMAICGLTPGAVSPDGGKGRDPMGRTAYLPGADGPSVPAIDRNVPAKVETAIFALG